MELNSNKVSTDELSQLEIDEIIKEVNARNKGDNTALSEFATSYQEATRQSEDKRRKEMVKIELNPFEVDSNRLAFSKEIERAARKTQVITNPARDHIASRLTHMQLVGKLAGSMARSLGHNKDLAETIGAHHDIGHAFFGHTGEELLTTTLIRRDLLGVLGPFKHNIQGLHVIDRIASRNGKEDVPGLNLTDQTRHGILSHDGEAFKGKIAPKRMNPEELDADIRRYIKETIQSGSKVETDKDLLDDPRALEVYLKKARAAASEVKITPATIEACDVFMADSLQYLPQDFENFIRMGHIKREHLPIRVAQKLGTCSADMIHTLMNDLIIHSYGKDQVGYSNEVAEILLEFKKQFMYPLYFQINDIIEEGTDDPNFILPSPGEARMQERVDRLFEAYSQALLKPIEHIDSSIHNYFHGRNRLEYYQNMLHVDEDHKNSVAILDYLAGFSDTFFLSESEKVMS